MIKPSESEWQKRKKQAKDLAKKRRDKGGARLIEVSSQHPLDDGVRPGAEFAARLDEAVRLYELWSGEGAQVTIFVPGSRHRYKGRDDKLSLSAAGKKYLLGKGVPEQDIQSEELIRKYKGDAGIYNSADEAFVAASYFKDGDFAEVHCIVAPPQLMRKALNYLWNGVAPIFHSIQTADGYHDFLTEAANHVPYTLTVDPDAQDPDSELAAATRKSRIPKS